MVRRSDCAMGFVLEENWRYQFIFSEIISINIYSVIPLWEEREYEYPSACHTARK